MSRITVFIDMDNTVCDYSVPYLRALQQNPGIQHPQNQLDFFRQHKPLEYALDCLKWMMVHPKYDSHILTAPSVYNPACYAEKRHWVGDHLGYQWYERLHISSRKDLFREQFLIDGHVEDHGQDQFEGLLVPFGKGAFVDWSGVVDFLASIVDRNYAQQEMYQLTLTETPGLDLRSQRAAISMPRALVDSTDADI